MAEMTPVDNTQTPVEEATQTTETAEDTKKTAKADKADKKAKKEKVDKSDKGEIDGKVGKKGTVVTMRTVPVTTETETPMLLEKQKWLFWVLVAVAIIGIVLMVVVFVVGGKGNDLSPSASPTSILDRLRNAGYTATLFEDGSPQVVETENLMAAAGQSVDVKWLVFASDASGINQIDVYCFASSSEVKAVYGTENDITSQGIFVHMDGAVIFLGTQTAVNVARGVTE